MTTTPETLPKEPAHKEPRLDLPAIVEKLKIPGIDTKKLVEFHRKDIEALLAANERAFVAIETLTRKQVDMLMDVLKEWQASAKEAISDSSGAEKINQAATRVQHAFKHALENMKEMAEIAAKSGQDVLGILNKRYREGVEELRNSIRPKS